MGQIVAKAAHKERQSADNSKAIAIYLNPREQSFKDPKSYHFKHDWINLLLKKDQFELIFNSGTRK